MHSDIGVNQPLSPPPRSKRLFGFIVSTLFGAILAGIAILGVIVDELHKHVFPSQLPEIPLVLNIAVGTCAFVIALVAVLYEQVAELRKESEKTRNYMSSQIGALRTDSHEIEKHTNALWQNTRTQMRLEPLALRSDELTVPVNVANFTNFLTYAPLYIAQELRLFELERLSISVIPSVDDLAAVRKVSEGAADIAITDPIYCCYDEATRATTRIVSPFLTKVAVWAMSKKPLNEYNGNVLLRTYPETSTAGVLARKWAQEQKNFPVECDFVALNSDESFSDYLMRIVQPKHGRQPDILFVTEPEASWVQNALDKSGQPRYPHRHKIEQADKPFLFTAIISRTSLIERHPYILRRFLKAIRTALLYIHSLPSLPPDISDDGELGPEWKGVATAVRRKVGECYPDGVVQLPLYVVARIIHDLRANDFFPKSVGMSPEMREGFETSYRAHNGKWTPHAQNAVSEVTAGWGF